PRTAAGPGTAPPGGPLAVLARPETVPEAALRTGPATDAVPAAGAGTPVGDGARQRVGVGQAAVLSSLVAGTPVPEGFDVRRMRVQSRALAAKRASVVAKIAPELPEILGAGFRPAFLAYARTRPMPGSYRRDALDFVEGLLLDERPERRELTRWWRERAESRPPGLVARLARAGRRVLGGR
ncbi:endonuclease, partial [Streptomyces sp. NPDC056503]